MGLIATEDLDAAGGIPLQLPVGMPPPLWHAPLPPSPRYQRAPAPPCAILKQGQVPAKQPAGALSPYSTVRNLDETLGGKG